MRFCDVIGSLRPQGDGSLWTAQAGEEWQQGRTLFGGLQAALCVEAMRDLVPGEAPLRVLQVTFIAPVPAGEPRIRVQRLRSGKSATQVEARILDGESVACAVLAIFGTRRESAIAIEPVPAPLSADAGKALEMPYLPGLTPAFTQHFAMRWLEGGYPFGGAHEAKTRIAIRFRDEPRIGLAQLIAIADSIPSPAISLLKSPAPASSLTWTLELLDDQIPPDASGWWRMDAEVTSARDGYVNQSAVLWSPQERAVALSRQSVVVFA